MAARCSIIHALVRVASVSGAEEVTRNNRCVTRNIDALLVIIHALHVIIDPLLVYIYLLVYVYIIYSREVSPGSPLTGVRAQCY